MIKDFNSENSLVKAHRMPIEHLTFSGGGAKGALYPGACRALLESRLFNGIKTISGSSAGAITSALLACGIRRENLENIFKNLNMTRLFGNPTGKLPFINKDGNPLYNFISDSIKDSILNYIQEFNKEEELSEIYSECTRKDGKILFSHLKILNEIDPDRFKKLKITAVKQKNGVLEIFDCNNTSNIEIALACRASASIPIVLKPVKIEGVEYVDGGYSDNFPTLSEDHKAKTLVFAFSNHIKAPNGIDIALNFERQGKISTPTLMTRILNFILRSIPYDYGGVGGEYNYIDKIEEGHQKIHKDYPLRTIPLSANGIRVLDLTKAQKNNHQLSLMGYFNTKDFLINHNFTKVNEKYEYSKLFFRVFKDFEEKGDIFSTVNSVSKKNKLNILFSFCDPRYYKSSTNFENVAVNFIKKAALNRGTNELDNKTTAIKCLTNALNDNTIPSYVKKTFIKILFDSKSLKKSLDEIREEKINITKFQFKPEHFKNFIDILKLKGIQNIKSQSNTRDLYKASNIKIDARLKQNAKIMPKNY